MSLVRNRKNNKSKSGNSSQKKQVAKAVTKNNDDKQNSNSMSEFDLYKLAIEADLAQLKTILDIDDKREYKAQAIEQNDYMTYLDRYKNSNANHPNIVAAWLVIWLVDLGRWNIALEYLPMLIEQQQKFPKGFNTEDWPTFFIDQLYDEGKKQLDKGRDAIEKSNVMDLFIYMTTNFETQGWVLNKVVGGKLFAMAAKLEYTVFNFGNAYRYCIKATDLNDGAGVKTLAEKVKKIISKETISKEPTHSTNPTSEPIAGKEVITTCDSEVDVETDDLLEEEELSDNLS